MTHFILKLFNGAMLKCCLLIVCCCCFTKSFGQIAEIRKLQKQLPAITDSIKYIDALNRIGLLIHSKSADSCFYYGTRAKAIADRLDYTKGRADALTNIAITLALKGLYSQSLTYYIPARNLFLKAGEQESATQLLMNCAISYDFMHNNKRSLEFAKRALAESKQLKSDSVVSMLLVNYVNLDYSLSPKTVNAYLNKARKIAIKYNDNRAIRFLKQIEADKLMGEGKLEDARKHITDMLAMARQHQDDYHEMEGLYLYANYYKARHNIDSAIACYKTIYSMAMQNNYGYWKVEILELLLDAYQKKHDVGLQLSTNKLLVDALKQNNANNSSFIGDYVQYNKTQQELNKYRTDYDATRRRSLWLVVVIVAVGIVAILIFRLYRDSKHKAAALALLNDKVSQQNHELQQTDEFKSKLISMLAHDFRSPLGSAISMMRLVRDDDDLEKDELDILYNSIETDMQNILLTFDNILQWVKKQMAGFTYQPEKLSVSSLMDEAGSMFKDVMHTKNLKLVNHVPQDIEVFTDKEIIQFINRNLIHNAVKFSPEGAAITVDARHEANETIFSVTDKGRGMTERQLNALFSFNTAPTDSSNKGAGIALTICKEFVSKLHGRIWAESKPGAGTTFFYTLPDEAAMSV